MGTAKRPGRVKFFVGLLTGDIGLTPKVRSALERRFGKIEFESPVLDFNHTEYYNREMGTGLKRIFYIFAKAMPLEGLYRAKTITNAIEMRFSKEDRRCVNIDPGYLDLSKVVLFSTKDYSHRIHAGRGIFAEVTLYFRDGSYRPWPWTYPDYKSEAYIEVFNRGRAIYNNTRKD